jgi:hypothetical protein
MKPYDPLAEKLKDLLVPIWHRNVLCLHFGYLLVVAATKLVGKRGIVSGKDSAPIIDRLHHNFENQQNN